MYATTRRFSRHSCSLPNIGNSFRLVSFSNYSATGNSIVQVVKPAAARIASKSLLSSRTRKRHLHWSVSSLPHHHRSRVPSSSLSMPSRSPPSATTANSRLSLIQRHLKATPFLELNTPYSTERISVTDAEFESAKDLPQTTSNQTSHEKSDTQKPSEMSSQAPHPTVLIPGPIEYDDAVLQSMAHFRYTFPF